MASVSRDAGGLRRVQFMHEGKRRAVRLGRCSARQAETIKGKIENLLVGRDGGVDPDTAEWLATISDDLHRKLAAVGLVTPRANSRLKEFIDAYLAERAADLKPQSRVAIGHCVRNLLAFFGPDKPMAAVTKDDALSFRAYLIGEHLAEATVRRRIGVAKQLWFAAMDKQTVRENPFKDKRHLPCGDKPNKSRMFFVTREAIGRVLESCPDAEWRCIVALARYGGLRTPSEILRLRWQDIDWNRGRMTVTSPKTQHHVGHESREIPLFAELRPFLMDVFETAEPGTEYVITRYRLNNLNLRQQFGRILAKAGVKPWPRIFQNLRSSRQTELAAAFPEHVACAWMGNSKLVAREHYLQVRDEDFDRAAQNAAQHGLAGTRQDSPTSPENTGKNAVWRAGAKAGDSRPDRKVGPEGFEPSTKWL
jgi:integrase